MESKHFNFYASTALNVVTTANPSGIWDMLIESHFGLCLSFDEGKIKSKSLTLKNVIWWEQGIRVTYIVQFWVPVA